MRYGKLGRTGIQVSVIGLGGHEYLADGSSRGFNEDRQAAVRPGYTAPGYGGQKRLEVVALALESGINLFDATIDPEKEALGRNLREVGASDDVYVQTRPEGMGYGYDPYNAKMAQLDLLRSEVQRMCKLMKRERIDILNIPFRSDALEHDPEYLDKIRHNVECLKREGLIQFASCDTGSGGDMYLTQIESGIFDSLAVNFNFANNGAKEKVIPRAVEQNVGVVTREAFMKGRIFRMGKQAGIDDIDLLARLGIKSNLEVDGVTTVLVGADNADHLLNALSAADNSAFNDEEKAVLDRICATQDYQEASKRKFI